MPYVAHSTKIRRELKEILFTFLLLEEKGNQPLLKSTMPCERRKEVLNNQHKFQLINITIDVLLITKKIQIFIYYVVEVALITFICQSSLKIFLLYIMKVIIVLSVFTKFLKIYLSILKCNAHQFYFIFMPFFAQPKKTLDACERCTP